MHHWKHRWGGRGPIHLVGLFVAFAIIGTLVALAFGYVTMLLWNWLVPPIFGLKAISYLQAFGLLLLSWLFFGRFRGGHHWHGRHWRHRWTERWVERWEHMTPEEREQFRKGMRGNWRHRHGWGPADDQDPKGPGNATA